MDILHYNTATCGRSSTAHPKTPAPPAHAEEQTPATERRAPSGAKEGSSSKDASDSKRKRNGAERNEIKVASSGRDAVPRDEQAVQRGIKKDLAARAFTLNHDTLLYYYIPSPLPSPPTSPHALTTHLVCQWIAGQRVAD